MSLAAEVCDLPRLASPGAVMAPLALPEPARWQPWRDRNPRRGAGRALRRSPPRARGRADARAVHQPGAGGRPGRVPRVAGLRRGRRRQGRRVRRDPRAGQEGRPGAGLRHAARRAVRSWAWPWAPVSVACCPSRRSSTWPTCTTPRTSCGARRRRCGSSPTTSSPTPWSCASPRTATRRGSAGTSTTTTPSGCCGTFRDWSSPHRPGPTTPPRCCAPAWPRRRRTGPCRCSSSPSRCTTPVTSTRSDDGLWLAPYSAPAGWAAGHVPIGRGRTHGDGRDLTIVTFGNGVPMSLRVARRLARAGSPRGCWTSGGWPRCRSRTSCARPPSTAGSWSSTRRVARAGCPRRWSRRWSTSGTPGHRQGHERGQLHPPGGCGAAGAPVRGDHRERRALARRDGPLSRQERHRPGTGAGKARAPLSCRGRRAC